MQSSSKARKQFLCPKCGEVSAFRTKRKGSIPGGSYVRCLACQKYSDVGPEAFLKNSVSK